MSCNVSWAPDLLETVVGGCSDTGSFFHLAEVLFSAVVSSLPGAACQPEGAAAGPQPAALPYGQRALGAGLWVAVRISEPLLLLSGPFLSKFLGEWL